MRSERRTVSEPGELFGFLCVAWPDWKRTRLKQALKHGGVRVNDAPVTRHDHPLFSGDVVSLGKDGSVRSSPHPWPAGLDLVHEDASILVIAKGPGWLSVARDSGKGRTAYQEATRHVRLSDPRSRVWIVHRLDRETSGLMIFAKTEAAKRCLQDQWDSFAKTYLAVVEGAVDPQHGVLRHFLDESSPLRVRVVRGRPGPEAREAVTRFRVLRRKGDRTLVELELETGRRHQIRVQLADLGHPVVGDERYGAVTDPARRLGLHAWKLAFTHPENGLAMGFEAPMPPVLAKLV